ncbi:magnesium-translocating P-type ATPase [Pseudoduganella flava]|nr:magnesium-translocating P-type ATPase [Pseudoduganella flava]
MRQGPATPGHAAPQGPAALHSPTAPAALPPTTAPAALPTAAALAALSSDDALAALGTASAGLPSAVAAARHAAPAAPAGARLAAWRHFARLAASPLSLLMLALAVLNYLTGARWSALLVAAIVLVSTLLSFVQERRSGRAAERLRALVRTTVVVRRPGAPDGRAEVPSAALVPGDVVLLAAGDSIPADLRIVAARDLFIDESALTGEAMPVEKTAHAVPDAATLAPLAIPNLAWTGCHVLSGSATAVVLATGDATMFGHIASAAADAREITAFDRGVARYVGLMLRTMLVLVPLVFLLNAAGKGDWLQALLFAVAVAVGMTPELLPMIVTVNLAQGALAMARRHVIVKRLNAIQNMGAMDVLCTDKTGTLTQNRVILERHVDYLGRESDRVTGYAWLNSHYQTGLRNLLDDAVLQYVAARPALRPDGGYDKVDELPFDFERRRMSVIVARPDGSRLLVCKGAVEEVVPACSHADDNGTLVPLQPHHGAALSDAADALNGDGFRVIAVATRELPHGAAACTVADERDLVLQGYIAFLDPPKESAARALALLAERGITVKVLTGDNPVTTASVCRHVGLAVHGSVTGAELAAGGPALDDQVAQATIFARVTPQQKADIIRALQRRGHVVGYLGDGINDTQALRAADVGISVDGAVDIAKDSADVILLQKSLLALADGVREGRRVFGNISKHLRISASSAAGNVLSIVGASVLLPFLPLAPAQILLNNLLYDLSQTALAGDRVDPGWLRRPRRWEMGEIVRAMAVLGPLSSLFDYLTFAALWYLCGGATNPALFQTGWFVESLLSQTLVVHVLRTARLPLVQSRSTPALAMTTAAVCAVGVWLPSSSVGAALGFVPLPPVYWLVLPALLAGYLGMAQWLKAYVAGPPAHSWRNASIGSSRAARRAGK